MGALRLASNRSGFNSFRGNRRCLLKSLLLAVSLDEIFFLLARVGDLTDF
jgi:hypothetical protein